MSGNPIKIREEILIAAPQRLAWSIVGNFENLAWVKGVRACHAQGHGQGAVRVAVSDDGQETQEECIEFRDSECLYRYRIIDPQHIDSYEGTLAVQQQGPDSSRVIWEGLVGCGSAPPDKITRFTQTFYRSSLQQLQEHIMAKKANLESAS